MTKKKLGWWGKFQAFFGEKPRMIWIGPMSQREMFEYYGEFRHNFRKMQESKKEIPKE